MKRLFVWLVVLAALAAGEQELRRALQYGFGEAELAGAGELQGQVAGRLELGELERGAVGLAEAVGRRFVEPKKAAEWAKLPQRSLRKALLGGNLGAAAARNGWAGVVIDGCVRDVAELATQAVGIRALASMPLPTEKRNEGQSDVALQIQGVWVHPDWRGRGLGAAGTATLASAVLRSGRTPSLYVNDFNGPARAIYQRIGFSQLGTYATILLD